MNLKKELARIRKISPESQLRKSELALLLVENIVNSDKHPDSLVRSIARVRKDILLENPRQPILKNSLEFLTYKIGKSKSTQELKEFLLERIKKAIRHIMNSEEFISEIGLNKIKKGMNIFVYGSSPLIIEILKKARQRNSNFVVNSMEGTGAEGKILANELAKSKIQTKYYANPALRQAMKVSDIVLLGADLISNNGMVYSEIGSELVAELAEKYEIPVYVCADSWMFSPGLAREFENVEQKPKKIWKNPGKGIHAMHYTFEKINPKLIAGIITGLGIYKPALLISETRDKYPWM